MDTKLQERYFRVRRELSGLNYSGNFGIDALDIVEQLFQDLVATTDSYSHMQEKEHQLSQNLALAQAQVFPLRKENAKLIRENQQLHAEVVTLKEDATNRNDSLAQKIRKLTEELEDVKYLCQSKDSEITKLEKERLRIKEAYENLASSSLLSGGVTVKRGIKLSSPAAFPNETISPNIAQVNTDGNIIDTLRGQVEQLQASLKTATSDLESTKDSLFRKDQELLKLSTAKLSVSGSAPQLTRGERGEPTGDQVEYLLGANRANQRIIDQLNTKVDFLNEQLAMREMQLNEKERQLLYLKELQGEFEYRGQVLEREKESNKQLISQLIALESRIQQVNQATDPATPLNSPFATPMSRREQLHTPSTDQEDEEERDFKKPLPEQQHVKQTLERSVSLVNEMSREENLLRARLKKMEIERTGLYSQVEKLTTDLLTQGQMLQDSRLVLDNSLSENISLREKLEKLSENEKEEIEKSEEDRSRIRYLESQLAVSESSRQRAESALAELKRDAFDLKKLLSEKSEQLDRVSQLHMRGTKEIETLQRQLRDTHHQILSLQNDISLITGEKENYLTSYHSLQIEFESFQKQMQREVEMQTQRNEQREWEAREQLRLENQRREDTRFVLEDREKDKRIRDLEMQTKRLEVETRSLTNTISNLEFSNQSLSTQLTKSSEEREQMEQLLFAEREKVDDLQNTLSQLKSENHRLQKQLENLQEQHQSTERHTNQVIQQVSENQSAVSELRSELKLSNKRLEAILKERDDLQEALNQLDHQNHQLDLDSTELRRQFSALQQQLKKSEKDLEDLREQSSRSRALVEEKDLLLKKRGAELKERDKMLEEAQRKYQEAAEVVRSMERFEKGSSGQVSRLEKEVSELKQKLESSQSDLGEHKNQIALQESKIQNLHTSLSQLDREYDALQHSYDAMLQTHQEDQLACQALANQYHDAKHCVEQREKQLSRLTAEFKDLRRQAERAEERYQSLLQEKNEMKRRLELKHSEVGAASEDLQLMTRENQSLTNELAAACGERDKLRNRCIGLTEQNSGLEQSVRALEMERSDLLDTYRTCLQEKRRLESDMNSMSGTKTKLAQTIYDLRSEIGELQDELNSRRAAENRQLAERSSLLLQLETLNSQLVETSKRVGDWETDANKQAQDNYSLKQTITTLQQRSVTLVSRAAAAADSNKILQARITALERERDSLRLLLDGERKRTSDLAHVVMVSRAEDARRSSSSLDSPKTHLRFSAAAEEDASAKMRSPPGHSPQGRESYRLSGESTDLSSITTHRSTQRPEFSAKSSKTDHTEELLGISSDGEEDDADEE